MIPESEALERSALEDLHRAAPTNLAKKLGIRSFHVGPAFVSLAAALPSSAVVINRTIGLGLSWPAEADEVVSVIAAYERARIKRYFIHLHPQAKPASIRGWLESHDLHEARGWQKFSHACTPAPETSCEFEIREAGPANGEDFSRIVCSAFDLGEAAVPWLAQIPGREGWHVFMSFYDNRPAGTGAMYVKKGLAWLDWAATTRRDRRRGSQAALQAARIGRAIELGCNRIYTCTGVAATGDPQHSYRNILRSGFRLEEIRLNFSPRR